MFASNFIIKLLYFYDITKLNYFLLLFKYNYAAKTRQTVILKKRGDWVHYGKIFFFSQTLIWFVQLQGLPKYIILKKMLHFTNDINSCDRPHLATRELNSARTESSGRMTLCGSKWT